MPVTLVVKTPHVKLPDLTFTFETDSAVLQLKTYLQDQYPSKPKPEEQRLIYSGKLLKDNELLQDFLRDLDSEQTHTIHLVYSLQKGSSPESIDTNTSNMSNVDVPITDDGLRLRTNIASTPSEPWINNGGQFPVFGNTAADAVAQQMLWWQQTYAQQYWAQYMHYMSNTNPQMYPVSVPPSTPVQTHLTPSVAPVDQQDHQQQQQQQPEAQRRPPLVVGGVAQEDEDDGGIRAARDWLDWIYIGSRLAILLGVMYFYSSLPRLMLVTFIVAGIYLYQKAIHQRRLTNLNAEVNNNNQGQQEGPIAEEPEVTRAPSAAAVTQQPSGLNVVVNLLIGLITSLIPEVPAPEALN